MHVCTHVRAVARGGPADKASQTSSTSAKERPSCAGDRRKDAATVARGAPPFFLGCLPFRYLVSKRLRANVGHKRHKRRPSTRGEHFVVSYTLQLNDHGQRKPPVELLTHSDIQRRGGQLGISQDSLCPKL
jgi:hypothetical protein